MAPGLTSCRPAAARASRAGWGKGVEVEPCRLAWCYGDAGVATTLLLAARCTGNEDWERQALRIADLAARRSPAAARVRDASLCHGAAGLGHLFNRLYQATGMEELAEASRSWFRHTLEIRHAGKGLGGFFTWAPAQGHEVTWRLDRGFLTGAAGTALALLGAVSSVEPEWDRVMLSSTPAQRTTCTQIPPGFTPWANVSRPPGSGTRAAPCLI